MRHRSNQEARPADVALGARIRLRRKQLGISQVELAKALGVTIQQLYKYENAINRVSFSRLVSVAQALSTNVTDLIAELNTSKLSPELSRKIVRPNIAGARDLVEAYNRISSSKNRRAVLRFARALARDAPT